MTVTDNPTPYTDLARYKRESREDWAALSPLQRKCYRAEYRHLRRIVDGEAFLAANAVRRMVRYGVRF